MRREARLFLLMLRFRVAAMIWLFFLLAAGFHAGLPSFRWAEVWCVLALGCSYVAATAANDVADRDIDRVNHPADRGRPLVTGEATEDDLGRLRMVASLAALAASAAAGWTAVALIVVSLGVGWAYSLPPLRLSYRTYLAPLILGVAYVAVPYLLGERVGGSTWRRDDGLLAAALFALFLARIVLKDFRDREGDARYGRPTFLLRLGKPATCAVSAGSLVVGDVGLVLALRPPLWLGALVQLLVVSIGARLLALRRAETVRDEQVAIGLGARLGNGLLLMILAWFVTRRAAADPRSQAVLCVVLAGLFVGSTLALARRPEVVMIGYKG